MAGEDHGIGQFRPAGGYPTQRELVFSRSVSRFDYAIRPPTNMCRSLLPEWQGALSWILASPEIGYGCNFAEYLLQLEPGGGSQNPEVESGVESFLYVLQGALTVRAGAQSTVLNPGGFAFLPPDVAWSAQNQGDAADRFLWVRKAYQPFGDHKPALIFGEEKDVSPYLITGKPGWGAKSLLPGNDPAYDMAMSIVIFPPGGVHAYVETHPEEHGLYMLQGQGVYFLGSDWHEVTAGDFIWMRPYCPQSYYAGGEEETRYLFYKNANRQVVLQRK